MFHILGQDKGLWSASIPFSGSVAVQCNAPIIARRQPSIYLTTPSCLSPQLPALTTTWPRRPKPTKSSPDVHRRRVQPRRLNSSFTSPKKIDSPKYFQYYCKESLPLQRHDVTRTHNTLLSREELLTRSRARWGRSSESSNPVWCISSSQHDRTTSQPAKLVKGSMPCKSNLMLAIWRKES